MRGWPLVVVLGLITLHATAASATQTNLIRSVSASRQFVAYADNPLLPAALGYVAEQVKRQWLRELNLRDEWRDPIVLVVTATPPTDSSNENPAFLVVPTALGWKYQITWVTPPPLDSARVVPALVEGLCAEWIQRTIPPASELRPLRVPPWIVLGLTYRIQGRDESTLLPLRRIRDEGMAPRAELLLSTSQIPERDVERDLFQIQAGLLWESLRALPGGAEKLQKFLVRVGQRQPPMDAFWETYREDFSNPSALERWWAVQFAARTAAQAAQNLTARETEQRLDRILRTRLWVKDDKTDTEREIELALADLAPYAQYQWLHSILADKRARLAALRIVALPAYRELITLYDEALRWLAEGQRVRFRRVLTRAEQRRAELFVTYRALEEYLDHIEWQLAPDEFAGGLRGALEILEELDRIQRQRRNPISEYLDRWER